MHRENRLDIAQVNPGATRCDARRHIEECPPTLGVTFHNG
jgi:hypothetical protein